MPEPQPPRNPSHRNPNRGAFHFTGYQVSLPPAKAHLYKDGLTTGVSPWRGITRESMAFAMQQIGLPGKARVWSTTQGDVITTTAPDRMLVATTSPFRAGKPMPVSPKAELISRQHCPECLESGPFFVPGKPERPYEIRVPITSEHRSALRELAPADLYLALERTLAILVTARDAGFDNATVTMHIGKRGRSILHPTIIIGLLKPATPDAVDATPAQLAHQLSVVDEYGQKKVHVEREFDAHLVGGRLSELLLPCSSLDRVLVYVPFPAYTRGQINVRLSDPRITNLVTLQDPEFALDKAQFFESLARVFAAYGKYEESGTGIDDVTVIVNQAPLSHPGGFRVEVNIIPHVATMAGEELSGHHVVDEWPSVTLSKVSRGLNCEVVKPTASATPILDPGEAAQMIAALAQNPAAISVRQDILTPRTSYIGDNGLDPTNWPVAALVTERDPVEAQNRKCFRCDDGGSGLAHPRIVSHVPPFHEYITNLFNFAGGASNVAANRTDPVFEMMPYPIEVLRKVPCFPGHLISFLSTEHKTRLEELSVAELAVWLEMIREIEEVNFQPQQGVGRICAFINGGVAAAGQSLPHLHAQYVAEAEGLILPIDIAMRRAKIHGLIERASSGGVNLVGHDLNRMALQRDLEDGRLVQTFPSNVHLHAPYAPRTTFELHVTLDRLGASDILFTTPEERSQLAAAIHQGVRLQSAMGVSNWNVFVAQVGWTAEAQASTHRLRVELVPRLVGGKRVLPSWGIFQKGYPIYCPPEEWAAAMKGKVPAV